jgi:hypothetical protein
MPCSPLRNSEFEPAEQIIYERLRVADLGVAGPDAGLKARVSELVTQYLQGHSLLQGKGERGCARIHQAGNG